MNSSDPDEQITTIITFEEQMRGWMSFLAKARSLTQQVAAYRSTSKTKSDSR
jgi:tRNA(fMet)-specific endonuclease VapC